MQYQNADIFTPERGFVHGGFVVEQGRFVEVFEGERAGGMDLGGALVIPGLVDLHVHGSAGADFSDGDDEGLRRMARYLASRGVTSFAPTSMTLPYETIGEAIDTARRLRHAPPPDGARCAGVHLEGPFFSEKKKGAQNAAYLREPDFEAFSALYERSGGLLRQVDLAPELEGAAEFTKKAKKLCRVSVAHTDASYDEARAVFEAGATHLTHLFNAMPPIHHRRPGVIGAAAEREDVCAELICDGYHVHPSAVRMAFRLFPGRICLISDALRCCGMPEGSYELGGQEVFLQEGVARLADGTIAGAASDLFCDMQNAIRFGIARDEAIRAATSVPARELGCVDEIGAIAVGCFADFVVCDGDLNRQAVYLGGQKL